MASITTASEPLPAPRLLPLSVAGKAVLVVLSVAAATIHLVMVPQHAGEWLPEGLAFAAAGWFQLGFALAVITRPTKGWLRAGIAANVVFVAAWAYTRTVGMPFGPEAGSVHEAQLIDLTCVGLEVALVLAASVLLLRPRLGESLDSTKLVMASIIPVGVLVLTTTALAAPSTANHSHGAESAAGHGHDEGTAGADHGHSDEHAHGATAVKAEDRCDWSMNTVAFWQKNPPAAEDTSHEHMTGSAAESAEGHGDTVGNTHGVQAWRPLTDKAECTQLQTSLDKMEAIAAKYPTLQSALDAGCSRVTVYVPGIASHLICLKQLMTPLDVDQPEMLLYGGNKPWAPLVGLSYYSMTQTPPGPEWVLGQMPFHVHEGLCFKNGVVIGGDGSDKTKCEARGGKVGGKTGYMGHYWMPTCNSPDGVFSADNPRLDMAVAQYNDDPRWDPAAGGDPAQLQADPCAGSKLEVEPSTDVFGAPPAAGTTENAAGIKGGG